MQNYFILRSVFLGGGGTAFSSEWREEIRVVLVLPNRYLESCKVIDHAELGWSLRTPKYGRQTFKFWRFEASFVLYWPSDRGLSGYSEP